ncbi:MAG: hypothetical protein ACQGVC_00360 [Myxococcota bacterium]
MRVPASLDAGDLRRFQETFLYDEGAFFVDEIVAVDREARALHARMDTTRELPISRHQRTGPGHPAHVSAADLLMVTGNLGCLHAWIFHGCRWDEGWTGFGNRIHRADFKHIARLGPPLELHSSETRTRVGPKRVVIRYAFRFEQGEKLVYTGDQSAMFFRDAEW